MGIVNLFKGLNSDREVLNFNGKLRDNLDLDWERVEILKNGDKLTPDYELQENEILIIQEYPGALSTGLVVTAIVLGVVSLGVGIGVGIYASEQVKQAQRDMEEAIKKIGKDNKQKDVSSIPQLADAKNEKIEGKNVPIILGRHLFAPYFLSDPYIRPEGADGEDLYWYGTFLVGQNGLYFEKIRNGTVDLVTEKQIFPAGTKIKDFVNRFAKASLMYNLLLERGGKYGNFDLPPDTYILLVKIPGIPGISNFTYRIDIPNINVTLTASPTETDKIIGQTIEINMLTSDVPQRGKFNFLNPGGDPPFYSPENFIEIVQNADKEIIPADTKISDFIDGYIPGTPTIESPLAYNLYLGRGGRYGDTAINAGTTIALLKEFAGKSTLYGILIPGIIELTTTESNRIIGQDIEIYTAFSEPIFEQKWVDSLDSSVELGRKKKDGAKTVNENGEPDQNGIYMEDDGEEPVIRETARFPMRAEIEIFFPEGLCSWDSKHGEETDASVEIQIEWSKKESGDDWRKVPIYDFSQSKHIITETIPSNTKIADYVNRYISNAPAQSATLSHRLDFPYGFSWGGTKIDGYIMLYKENRRVQTGPGSYAYFIIYFLEVYKDNEKYNSLSTSPSDNNKTLGKDISIFDIVESPGILTRAKSKQMRFLAEVDFPSEIYSKSGDPMFIRATRKTRIHTGTYRSRVYLSAIRTRQYNPNTSSPSQLKAAKNINSEIADKFCRLGIKIKVNKNTQEFMDRFNVVASMTGRTALKAADDGTGRWAWNGEWSTVKTKTSNSAAVLLELITGLIHEPSKHKDSEIDLKSFGKLYEYCMNRKITIKGQGEQEFTLECNGVLTSGTRKIDAIQSILATCDGGIYIDEFGKLEVYFEDVQTTPIGLLNPQRIISMVDQRSLERKTDGYTVEFVDQESDFQQVTHRTERENVVVKPGLTTYSPMRLDFTTSYNQAMWHARRLLAKEEYRPGELKVTVGKEGRYYKPGSLIKVQHERFKIGLGSGEIVQLIMDGKSVVGLKLMEKFDISDVRDYWIEYFVVDGDQKPHVVKKQIESVGQYTDTLMFTASIDINEKPEDVPAFGNIMSTMYAEGLNTIGMWEAKRYIVTDLSENKDGYDLVLAEYAEKIYQTGEIGKRKSSILSAPPMAFADQQRGELQTMLKTAIEQTSPPFIASMVKKVFDGNIAEAGTNAPRFRGVYYVAGRDEDNGMINGDQMNPNDWVYFASGGKGDWAGGGEDYVWQWTGVEWKQRPRPSDDPSFGWLYLDAVSSSRGITEGADIGIFSDVFCKAIVAARAFFEYLYTKNAIIKDGGSIQSQNWSDIDKTGFLISDGTIKLYNGTIEIGSGTGSNYRGIIIDGVNKVIKSSDFISGSSGFCLWANYQNSGKSRFECYDGVFGGSLSAAKGTFAGALTANSITLSGGHEVSANNSENTEVVAFDNMEITDYDIIPQGIYTSMAKKIRVAGTGNVKFRVRYRGRCALWKQRPKGVIGQAELLHSFDPRTSMSEEWSPIITFSADVNIIYLQGGDASDSWKNDIFECRTSSNPGIFKFMSSPF